jgi:hypothetical protein
VPMTANGIIKNSCPLQMFLNSGLVAS